MAARTLSKCPTCGYPITAEYEGQTAVCSYCGSNLIAQEGGVTIPTPLFVGLISFGLGVFLGPALIASTAGGREWLEKQAREAIRR